MNEKLPVPKEKDEDLKKEVELVDINRVNVDAVRAELCAMIVRIDSMFPKFRADRTLPNTLNSRLSEIRNSIAEYEENLFNIRNRCIRVGNTVFDVEDIKSVTLKNGKTFDEETLWKPE